MWTPLKKILKRKIKTLGLGQEFFLMELAGGWDHFLEEELGKSFKGRSRAAKINNGVLIVVCANSVWANELQIKEFKILNRLKQKYKNLPFGRIKFMS